MNNHPMKLNRKSEKVLYYHMTPHRHFYGNRLVSADNTCTAKGELDPIIRVRQQRKAGTLEFVVVTPQRRRRTRAQIRSEIGILGKKKTKRKG